MNRVVLKPKRDWSVRKHHPWIFSGAIAFGEAGVGETVEVVSAEGEMLGYGSFSPASQIRVRMLSFDPKRVPDGAYVAELVAQAISRRAAFFNRRVSIADIGPSEHPRIIPGLMLMVW